MDDEPTVDCELHGRNRRISFVCTHTAYGILDATSPGFVVVPDAGEALPLAWCDDCEAFVTSRGDGTWTEELRDEADFKLLCEDCYAEAKGLRVYKPTTETVTSQHEWVRVEILAQGNRVRSAFNGVEVMEWREADLSRVKAGPIGMQLHAWGAPQEVLYKDIQIETFPKQDRLLTVKRQY